MLQAFDRLCHPGEILTIQHDLEAVQLCLLSGVHLFGKSIFDFLDSLCSNWLMPLGGLMFTLFVGWKMSRNDVEDEFTNHRKLNRRSFPLVYFLIRYIAPVGIVIVFLSNLLL